MARFNSLSSTLGSLGSLSRPVGTMPAKTDKSHRTGRSISNRLSRVLSYRRPPSIETATILDTQDTRRSMGAGKGGDTTSGLKDSQSDYPGATLMRGLSHNNSSNRNGTLSTESGTESASNTTVIQESAAVPVDPAGEPDFEIVTTTEHDTSDGIHICLHDRTKSSKIVFVADCWHQPLSNLWRSYWEIRASTSIGTSCSREHDEMLRSWEHPQWLSSKRLWRSAIPDNQMRDQMLTVALRTLRRVVSTQTSMIVNEAVKHGLRWVTLEALARLSGELDSEIEKLTVRTSCRRDASRLSGRKRY